MRLLLSPCVSDFSVVSLMRWIISRWRLEFQQVLNWRIITLLRDTERWRETAEDLKLLTLKSNSFCAINNESFTWRCQLVQRMSSNNSFQFLTEKKDLKSERVYHHHASMTSVNMTMEVCNARKCKKERQRRTTTGTGKLKWNLCDDAALTHGT